MITTRNYTRRSWDEWYSEAVIYFAHHGDLLVPGLYVTEDGVRLGRWIERMRAAYSGKLKTAALSAEQVRQLEEIGMVWQLEQRSSWGEWLHRACAYRDAHGDLLVAADYDSDGFHLGFWIAEQRKRHDAGVMTEREKASLDALGMVWEIFACRSWDDWLAEARAYYLAHGDLLVPTHYVTPSGNKLGKWIAARREAYSGTSKRAELTPGQIAALERLGMVWDLSEYRRLQWDSMYDFVKAYKTANGRLPLWPRDLTSPEGRKPYHWITVQRRCLSSGKLAAEQAHLLHAVGIY